MALRFLNSGYFAGKVGIGTETPTAPLDVFGVRAGRDWALSDRAVIRLDSNGAGFPSDILFGHTAAANQTSWTGVYWSLSSRGSSDAGKFHFYRGNGHDSPYSSEAVIMTFKPDLKVGIGTTNPAQNFVVADATNGNGVEFVPGSTSTIQTYNRGTSSYNNLNIDTASTRVRSIDYTSFHNGNAYPEKMRITSAGGISFGSTGTAYGTLGQILKSNGNASPTWIDGSAIPGVPAGSGTLNTIPLWTPDGDTLGNSIITQPTAGTIDISGLLRVSSTAAGYSSTKIQTGEFTSSQAGINILNSTTGYGYILFGDGAGADLYRGQITYKHGDDYMSFNAAGGEKMRIDSAGNVGIGKTPQARNVLDIQRNDTLGSFITHRNDLGFALNRTYADYGNDGDTVEYQERIGVDGNNSSIGNYSNHTLAIRTNNQDRITILAGGNVGIGVTGPSYPLDVNGIIRSENSSEVGTLYLGNTAQSQIPGGAIIGQRSPSYSSTGNLLFQVPTWGAGTDYGLTTQMSIEVSTSDTKKATISMIPFGGNVEITNALLSNQENTDVDTGTETVANVAIATYTAAFFDFVIKKTTNVRSGTVYACHDGTNVEFTETSTQDLGDTSDVTLSVDISGGNMRLLATVTSDDWSVKSLIRAI